MHSWLPSVVASLTFFSVFATPRAGNARDRSVYAVIIGNNVAPGSKLKPLRYADDDAARFAELFTSAGIHTQLLVVADSDTRKLFGEVMKSARAPTRANLQRAVRSTFEAIRTAEARGDETSFYFVYSGHGNLGRGNEGQLFLHNGKLSRGDLMRDIVGKSPATFNHLIIDACHSYFMVEPKGGKGPTRPSFAEVLQSYIDRERLSAHPNTGVIVSTSSRAEVHEHSVLGAGLFSHQVRSALAGAADVDNDGKVTYNEIGAFLAAANQGVPDLGTKLNVYARPPVVSNDVPVFLTAGIDDRSYVRLDREIEGPVTITDDRGVRYLDLNKAGDTQLTVGLVPRPSYEAHAGNR